MQETERDRPWARLFELFAEGRPIESIVSGWRLSEARIAELLLAGYRAGERIDPKWITPGSVRSRLLDVVDDRPELSPVEISSLFKGKVSPHIVKVLRTIRGGGRGMETRVFNEGTFAETFHDDVQGAKNEIIIVAPELKARHWRRWLEPFRRVRDGGGQVAFFVRRVSELVEEELKDERFVIIEKHSHANLVLIDGATVWEGSMNFLLPPDGEEHVRRSVSRLLADELRDLHDLFL